MTLDLSGMPLWYAKGKHKRAQKTQRNHSYTKYSEYLGKLYKDLDYTTHFHFLIKSCSVQVSDSVMSDCL